MHKEGGGMTNHKHWQEKEWDNYFETGQSRRDTASPLEWAALSLSLSLPLLLHAEGTCRTWDLPTATHTGNKRISLFRGSLLQLDTKKCTHTQGEKKREGTEKGEGKEYWSKEGTPTSMRAKRRGRKEADSCQMESEKDIDNDRCMFGMEADHNRNWYCIWLGWEVQIADWVMEMEWANEWMAGQRHYERTCRCRDRAARGGECYVTRLSMKDGWEERSNRGSPAWITSHLHTGTLEREWECEDRRELGCECRNEHVECGTNGIITIEITGINLGTQESNSNKNLW